MAKLFAADRWIVLDDVQFARRDYQHRARLAALDGPARLGGFTVIPRCSPLDPMRLWCGLAPLAGQLRRLLS